MREFKSEFSVSESQINCPETGLCFHICYNTEEIYRLSIKILTAKRDKVIQFPCLFVFSWEWSCYGSANDSHISAEEQSEPCE